MRRAPGAATRVTSSLVPTATIRLLAMATACAARTTASTVSTRPFTRSRFARGCCAASDVASAVAMSVAYLSSIGNEGSAEYRARTMMARDAGTRLERGRLDRLDAAEASHRHSGLLAVRMYDRM